MGLPATRHRSASRFKLDSALGFFLSVGRRRVVVVTIFLCASTSLVAQTRPADSSQAAARTLRVAATGVGSLRGATRVVVPTALLHLSMDGAMRLARTASAAAPGFAGTFRTTGLRKQFVAALAEEARKELIGRLTAAGLHVVPDDSVIGHPAFIPSVTLSVDTTYGTPIIRVDDGRVTYSIVAPDKKPIPGGGTFRKEAEFRELARSLNALVIVPELVFNAPQVGRAAGVHPGAGVLTIFAGMDLHQAGLSFISPSGSRGTITLTAPIYDLDPGVGRFLQIIDPTVRFPAIFLDSAGKPMRDTSMIGNPMVRMPASGQLGAYDLVIDEMLYRTALLTGARMFFLASVQRISASRLP